ncbi:hypothetical protein R3I94_010428 [Phoxinus phoxinus]
MKCIRSSVTRYGLDDATRLVLDHKIIDAHQQPTSLDIQILTEGFLLPLHLPFA